MKKEEMLLMGTSDDVVLNLFEVAWEDRPIIMDHIRQELTKFSLIEDNINIMSAIAEISIARIIKTKPIRSKISDDELKMASSIAIGFMFGYLYRMKEMHSSL